MYEEVIRGFQVLSNRCPQKPWKANFQGFLLICLNRRFSYSCYLKIPLKTHYSLMGIFPSFGVALIDPTEHVLSEEMDIY